ncbi:MAG TPA: efflux RND transporter periplasmic adaptor subunit [Steroidobacteraceae bacterium]|jgi:multidrug efflux system membrane fusion protein
MPFKSKAFSLTVLLAGAMLQSGCGSRAAAGASPDAAAQAPEITAARVIARPLHHFEELTGTLQAVDVVSVHARVSGYVNSVQFVEGTHVRRAQLLFQIDPRPFQLEVERLAAELKRGQSKLDVANAGRARADRLWAQNAIAREEFEQLTAAQTEAEADLASVRAQLDAARLNLEFTHVRSPIDGRVSRAIITPGNLVSSADVLTTVVSDDPIYAYFDTDEATYLKFAHEIVTAGRPHAGAAGGSPVYLGLAGEDGYPHQGRLDFLDNQLDAHSGTIRARAVFDNRDGQFTPGLFARIKLVSRDAYDAVLIDERAIGTDLGKKFVLVLKPDDTLEYRPIELGADVDGLRVVQQGLRAEDVIVVNGLQHVMPGIKVRATLISMQSHSAGLDQVAAGEPVAPASRREAMTTAASAQLITRPVVAR